MDDQRIDREGSGYLIMLRFILVSCLIVAGCERSDPRRAGIPSPKGIRFGIAGGVGSCTSVGNTAHIVAGKSTYNVVVEDGKITVNGLDYGTVNEGDQVIGTEGALWINDHPVQPKENSNPTH